MGLAWGGTGAFLLAGSHPLASAQVLAMQTVTSLPAWLSSGQSSTTGRQEVGIMLLEGSLGDPVGKNPQSPSVCCPLWWLPLSSSALPVTPSAPWIYMPESPGSRLCYQQPQGIRTPIQGTHSQHCPSSQPVPPAPDGHLETESVAGPLLAQHRTWSCSCGEPLLGAERMTEWKTG